MVKQSLSWEIWVVKSAISHYREEWPSRRSSWMLSVDPLCGTQGGSATSCISGLFQAIPFLPCRLMIFLDSLLPNCEIYLFLLGTIRQVSADTLFHWWYIDFIIAIRVFLSFPSLGDHSYLVPNKSGLSSCLHFQSCLLVWAATLLLPIFSFPCIVFFNAALPS